MAWRFWLPFDDPTGPGDSNGTLCTADALRPSTHQIWSWNASVLCWCAGNPGNPRRPQLRSADQRSSFWLMMTRLDDEWEHIDRYILYPKLWNRTFRTYCLNRCLPWIWMNRREQMRTELVAKDSKRTWKAHRWPDWLLDPWSRCSTWGRRLGVLDHDPRSDCDGDTYFFTRMLRRSSRF